MRRPPGRHGAVVADDLKHDPDLHGTFRTLSGEAPRRYQITGAIVSPLLMHEVEILGVP
jgi:hypothetical protein